MFEQLSHMNEDRESEFTLVELLVVIVIIGILVAIAIGVFLTQRKKANDASLKSDMKNVATVYEMWKTTPGNNDAKFIDMAGRTSAMFVHPDADYIKSSSTKEWNDLEGVPKFEASDSNFVMLNVQPLSSDREGEYCLVGTNDKSDYNYEAGSGNPSNYDKTLYYDSLAGGLKTIEQLSESYSGPESCACYSYVEKFGKHND